MPNYSSLSTQIDAIKSEISSSLAASAYSAQDLVYVAKALQALGTVVAPDGVSNITVLDNIYLGSTAEAFATTAALTNPNLVIAVDETDYAQIAFTNRSSKPTHQQILFFIQIMVLMLLVILTWVLHLLTLPTQTLQSLVKVTDTYLWSEPKLEQQIKVT
jgi:hypothetical protein